MQFPARRQPPDFYSSSEEELNAAIEEARDTIDTQDGTYDDKWVRPVNYYDSKFTTCMMDGLTYDKTLHSDRILDVPLKKVVDRMIAEKDGTQSADIPSALRMNT